MDASLFEHGVGGHGVRWQIKGPCSFIQYSAIDVSLRAHIQGVVWAQLVFQESRVNEKGRLVSRKILSAAIDNAEREIVTISE